MAWDHIKETKVYWFVVEKEDKDGEVKKYFTPAGVKVTLGDGITFGYHFTSQKFNRQMPAYPERYRSNTPTGNMIQPSADKGIDREKFVNAFPARVVSLVDQGVTDALAEFPRKLEYTRQDGTKVDRIAEWFDLIGICPAEAA